MIPIPSLGLSPGTDAEEHEALISVARDFARSELKPRSALLDEQDKASIDWCWSSIGELGFDCAVVPQELGGPGIGLSALLGTVEELATGDAGVAMLVLLSNVALSSLPPNALVRMEPGERWTIALPVASLMKRPPHDFVAHWPLDTRAAGDGFDVDGELLLVIGAAEAQGIALLSTRTPCALALTQGIDGLEVIPRGDQLGLRAAVAAQLKATDVHFDAVDLEPAMLHPLYAGSLLHFGVAAIARGIQRTALEMAAGYAVARKQGGVTIIHHGAVRELLSNIAAPLDAGCSLHWPAEGGRTKLGSPLIRAGLAAKIQNTDDAVAATTDAVQVFGGAGYMVETGIEKLMRDAKYCQLMPEANWRARESLTQEIGHPRPE